LNKTTVPLKEAILAALEAAGGDEGSVGYLRRLAIENSSAFAGLVAKVLPTTLSTDESNGGLGVKMTFERVIVWPDGHREIEGVTPKQLPAPNASHASDLLILLASVSVCGELRAITEISAAHHAQSQAHRQQALDVSKCVIRRSMVSMARRPKCPTN
jgi:hypothetical protein